MAKNKKEPIDKIYSGVLSALGFLWDLVKTAFIVAIIAFAIRIFLIEPFVVQGSSMEPNFQNYDYLLVEKIGQDFSKEYKRGSVVVFHPPDQPNQNYIKRVIGLPGEEIFVRDGSIIIQNSENPNGFVLDEPYLDPNQTTEGSIDQKLGENQYYLLGDNRDNSKDSRSFGPVTEEHIIGRAWIKAVSSQGTKVIGIPNY